MGTLMVWDFDWSLIEENSDTFVIEQIGAQGIYSKLREGGMPWTTLMDASLVAAHRQLGVSEADVLAALVRTPLHPSVAEAVRILAATGTVESIVISDANTLYIDTILRHHSLREFFSEVYTNPAEFQEGALRVRPYHTKSHGCPRHCPVNLCKGQVLREFLSRQMAHGKSYERMVYVGDGRGDWCPTVELQQPGMPPSVVLARTEYPDGVPCTLWVKLRAPLGNDVERGSSDGGVREWVQVEEETGARLEGQTGGGSGTGGGRRVLGWSSPEELAALLQQMVVCGMQ